MTSQEVYDKLMKYRNDQVFLDVDPEVDYFNAIMFDISRCLGLSDKQAAELAGDIELPSDLITITEAADMLGYAGTSSVSNLITRGKLTGYTDPDERNPRKSRRVSRAAVESLI